ncbi:MAG: amino acid adenylation domain-containing protein, partial [bacterium]|nr:amino acid adenylation domain-containing protein [bacterium]
LRGETLDRLVAYWRERLGSPPPVVRLPADRPRPARMTTRGASLPVVIDPSLTAALRPLSSRRGASLYMTLLAAFQVLLRRSTGQQDLSVGTFIANRNRPEIEPLIGFFVNTLVLRTRLADDASCDGPTFEELLDRVREVTLGAYEHQDLPFERLLEILQIERSLSHTPLFQVMLVLQNMPRTRGQVPGLSWSPLGAVQARSHFDLTLWLSEWDGGLSGRIDYCADLFDPTTIRRFVEHLRVLLQGASAAPEERICALPLVSAAQRQQLLGEWSHGSGLSYDPAFRELFETRAGWVPETVALVDPSRGEALSYRELNRRSNRLAHCLRERGVSSEVRVGLLLERSCEQVVAVLGILKAGGAYVPLDPDYPSERLALIMEDARIAVLLTHRGLDADLPELDSRAPEVIALDREAERIACHSPESPAPAAAAEGAAAAYVIYTSGSTGRPKGVVVSQRSLAWYAAASIEHYALVPEDRVLQFSSISFDISVEEIFPCLAHGATLVLRTAEMAGAATEFYRRCREWSITGLFLPTAFWHELAAEVAAAPESFPETLRMVSTGGERMLPERVAGWRRAVGRKARMMNSYGPTETTVVATLFELTPDGRADAGGEDPPIGRAVPNARVAVHDRAGRAVAIGVAGELVIGGDGLARGYLGHPAATAERFIPAIAGERLYRTGDLVRFLADGHLEFLGRIDDQVKIRGFRVEPGEVEALLDQHPGVREAAVTAREKSSGVRRLVGYVVPRETAPALGIAELRDFLAATLPEYMVPAAFVFLEALPRTPNNKVDRAALGRRALPAPERDDVELASRYVEPRTQIEEVLAGIWAECLDLDRVGVHDDFFELGGHSLVLIQIIARIRKLFGVEIPLRALFEAPTVAALAPRVEAAEGSDLPPIRPVPRDRDLPLSFAQERLWFLTQLDPRNTSYHVPRTYRIGGDLEVAAMEWAYSALIRRHEVLRTTFPTVAGRPVQRIHPPRPFRLPVIDLSGLPEAVREAELRRLILAQGRRIFDLARGPLLRARLVRLEPTVHALIQIEHHLVHDGWTEGVLVGDFMALFRAVRERRPSPLGELPIQFADFAAWQREWIRGEVLEGQLAYWREQLAGAPALSELPGDRPRPPILSTRGRARNQRISAAQTEELSRLSRRSGVTLFMTTLAAYKALIYRYGGQQDLVVGTGVANRRLPEIEGMVGMVINTLALRTSLRGDPPFRELLDRVRGVCLGAFSHEDLPFEKLVETLRPERNLSHAPVFQSMFAFYDAPRPWTDITGLTIASIESHNRSAKFDLVLIFAPPPAVPGEIIAHLEWSTDLFDDVTIQRFWGHYLELLMGAAVDSDRPLSELPLVTAAERQQLVREWSRAAAVPLRGACAHQRFEEQARRRPQALAIAAGGERLSYGELNARADALAVTLRRLGVGPEVPVGLCLERSPELVIAALAVLKAGGAYVPLDPEYPVERLAFMLDDVGAPVVLTREAFRERLPKIDGRHLLCLGTEGGEAPGRELEVPAAAVPGPENLAYVIYTSGSTGRPKGVAVRHEGLTGLVGWHLRTYGVTPQDRATLVAGPGFDASVWELWPYLAAGASLCIPDEETRCSPSRLVGWLVEREITLSFLPTPWAEAALKQEWPGDGALRALLTGGDRLHHGLRGPRSFALVNHYGPTEATVVTTAGTVVPDASTAAAPPPIGRPITPVRALVIDAAGVPVPAGVPGELAIGGVGLARGYHGHPALTAEKFVPDPFSDVPGRLYLTGDQVRWRPDGELEFVGRIDAQIKVRGFRVEPGEIEAILGAHPAVREAAVILRDGARDGGGRLVACVIAEDRAGAGEDELRRHLRSRLPEYMVPSLFVFLPALPLTPNGKVDRAALGRQAPPAAEPEAAESEAPPAAPRGLVEERVAAVWSEVLELERVGRDDNFFDLGGHSLLVLEVHERLRSELGRELPVIHLFRYPTVRTLAAALDSEGPAAAPRPALRRAAAEGHDVAIVGMALRFPGADDPEQFWRNLCDGVELVSFFSPDELRRAGVDPAAIADPAYVPASAVLAGVESFYAAFFGFSPLEAATIDPQHRIFLEVAWEALERAGYDALRYRGRIGVFAGVGRNTYFWNNLSRNPEVMASLPVFQLVFSNEKDFLTTRVSYKLDLRGPSLNVQTACSTSLVATHLAVRSLLDGECETALAGGVTVRVPQGVGSRYQEGGILSPDGHCRPFDAAAGGTVGGNGAGVVVLKRLADALADGDPIHAVVKGSAINNDGAFKIGFTAPSVEGQVAVVTDALARAGVEPETIDYVECHGTGTALGDPIEATALNQVFRGDRPRRSCAIGSVKSNFGHLDAAAGVAGLIKAALAVEHGRIPPSLNFREPNPEIDFDAGPLYVATEL